MRTRILSLLPILAVTPLWAASGGPDAYGYTWKDNFEADGPVFSWVDITDIGIQVTGLGDDNVVGPFVMQTNMPYYWYDVKNVWIGSNGYIAFNSGNIASPFQQIPNAGGVNDFIAMLLSDLNFAGAGNPGNCYIFDDQDLTIISFVDVPFWTQFAPGWTGSNSFQILLDKVAGNITIQFLEQTGLTMNDNLVVGIESIAGSIGLEHSFNTYPTGPYAVRFEPPVEPLIDVTDGRVAWNTEEGTGGRMLSMGSAPLPLVTNVINNGNTDLENFNVQAQILNAQGVIVLTLPPVTVQLLEQGVDTIITFAQPFDPQTAGTYRFIVSISGITGDLVPDNNTLTQELVVYDTDVSSLALDWAGPLDNAVGLSWSGGNGGVGTYIIPPAYPAYITHTTVRIVSNTGNSGFLMRVYADDGPDGLPGTLLDSVMVPAAQATAGDKVIPLAEPFLLEEGGVYVQWYMLGENINIAVDVQPPFSLRSFEVLDNIWADYRSRLEQDFHLGLIVSEVPFRDLSCTGFFGISDGQVLSSATVIRAFVTNTGNVAVSDFTMNYQFGNGAVVTQPWTGAPLQPGAQQLINFTQQLVPDMDLSADLCAWSALVDDELPANDTLCIAISLATGLDELAGAGISLGPNPTRDRLRIDGLPTDATELLLFDARGAAVLYRRIDGAFGTALLDLGSMVPGMYTLRLMTSTRALHGRIVVQH